MLLLVAWRNFRLQIKRLQVVLSALTIGFAILLVMVAVTSGMTQSLRLKAARYFSGDVAVFSFLPQHVVQNPDAVSAILQKVPGFQGLTRRVEYLGGDSSLYFDGQTLRQRKLIGIDWAAEAASFRGQDLESGAAPLPQDTEGLLVSKATAQHLNLKVGDTVSVAFNTLRDQRNTLQVVVRGIYRDSSLFGFASYVDRETLSKALGYPSGVATTIGVILVPGIDNTAAGLYLVEKLAAIAKTYPLISDRDERARAISKKGNGASLGVMTLDANLAQIEDILGALMAVTWLACGIFLAILMIGVANTYRMIVVERRAEIGTMRALGLSRARLLVLFVLEALLLGGAGMLLGGVLAAATIALLQVPVFEGNSMIMLFLSDGHLAPWLPLGPLLLAAFALLATTAAGAWFPALAAARQRPVDALREGT